MTLRELCVASLRAKGRDEENIAQTMQDMGRMSQRIRDRLDVDMSEKEQTEFLAILDRVYELPLSVSAKFVTAKLQQENRNQ